MEEETAKYYTFVHNLQGDILGLFDRNQDLVVEYRYDPWGKVLDTICGQGYGAEDRAEYEELAKLNPFRYRGYLYDDETGLYYLRTRYYNPTWGRFVNEDSLLNAGGLFAHNMFAYCKNNPVIYIDDAGEKGGINLGRGYSYRIDPSYIPADGAEPHIHITRPDGLDWKQKSNGAPYEPNHRTTAKGAPPKWIRDLLKAIKNNNDRNGRGGSGGAGEGWDWDGNAKNYEKQQEKGNKNEYNPAPPTSEVSGWEVLKGIGHVIGFGVATAVLYADNFTPIGGADDHLLLPATSGFSQGVDILRVAWGF